MKDTVLVIVESIHAFISVVGRIVMFRNAQTGSKDADISMHSFVTESKLRKEWIRKLQIGKKVPRFARVCSGHFTLSDFRNLKGCKRRLKINAIPSKNLPIRSLDERFCLSSPQKEKVELRVKRAERRRKLREDDRCAEDQAVRDEFNDISSDPDHDMSIHLQPSSDQFKDVNADVSIGFKCTSDDIDAVISLQMLNMCTGASTSTSEKKDVSVQVQLDDLSAITVSHYIKTETHLSSFCGVNTFRGFDQIAQTMEKVIDRIKYGVQIRISTRELLFVCLVKLKTDLSFTCLAPLFNVSLPTIISYFNLGIDILYSILKNFIRWPSKDEIRKTTPVIFHKYPHTRVILDCSEIRIEQINCLDCQVKTYSSYYGDHTLKWLIGIAPSGLVTFISSAYGGSDKFIVNDCGILSLLDPNDGVMVDKGFRIDEEVANVHCKLIRPPFLIGKRQFSVAEGHENADIAQVRVHVKRAIQRVKVFGIFNGVLSRNLHGQADKILTIICGLVNLETPIIANNDNFQS